MATLPLAYGKFVTKYVTLFMPTKGKICDKHIREPHMFLHIQNWQAHMREEHILNM